ncbi:MAG: hypothetical protein HUK21_05195 [Fibrobacteraceae bacterium]|nr:hypothetical protein [Fibrobacteraceae bacterium]
MFKKLFWIGLVLLVPGATSLLYSLYFGPGAWTTDGFTFWGTPISLFVFWIGLSHAGTLISAVLLCLDIKLDRRTSMLAELSTLCSLLVAAIFPLIHLGVVPNFYMIMPLLDGRGNFSNLGSPLVWDFCCIAIYGILSFLFFTIHILGDTHRHLRRMYKPFAWILFPLVLWVHTVVSLDFATTFVPHWRGSFFPIYFIVGALYSGLALINLLLTVEGYRIRLLEKLMLVGSWFLLVIWFWNFVLKGEWYSSAFIFGVLFVQFLLVMNIRESRWGRGLISFSVLVGLFLERYFLVVPYGETFVAGVSFGIVDLLMILFSIGLFMSVFFGLRYRMATNLEHNEVLMGDVDVKKDSDVPVVPIYQVLRFPFLCGILFAMVFLVWAYSLLPYETFDLPLTGIIPLSYPLIAFMAALTLCGKAILSINKMVPVVFLALLLILFGIFYGGGSSQLSNYKLESANLENHEIPVEWVWKAKCASCHGVNGGLNQKFIREFYPVPQNLTLERLDSLGVDSLINVVTYGRGNMQQTVDKQTARRLVQWMYKLAKELK